MIGKWLNLKVDSDKASTYCDKNIIKTQDLIKTTFAQIILYSILFSFLNHVFYDFFRKIN